MYNIDIKERDIMAMKFYEREYLLAKMKADAEYSKELNYKDELKVFLSLSIAEVKGTKLHKEILRIYPDIDPSITLRQLRTMKMLEKMFVESSQKAMELSYKLDGSMSDLSVSIDFNEIDEGTEGIK